MSNAFSPISANIEVDFLWREVNPKVLRQPSIYEPQESRVVFHETVHYWQQLGQGFMAKLVQEDWLRLLRFEKENVLECPQSHRLEFVRQDTEFGFSAYDIYESLARFWDVHVIGPHRLLEMDFADPRRSINEFFKLQYFALKEKGKIVNPEHGGYSDLAFDMAMNASAGNYAKPYQYIRERFNPVVTGTGFPIVGYFALQTEKPVEVFIRLIEAVSRILEQLPRNHSIHELWKISFPIVRSLAFKVTKELGISNPQSAFEVITNGELRDHPVYRWIICEISQGSLILAQTSFASEVTRDFGPFTEDMYGFTKRGFLALEFCLCFPGDTTNRSFLIERLAPPCVSFPDGRRWLMKEVFRRELVSEIDNKEQNLTKMWQEVVENVVDVQERWLKFRHIARGY